MKPRTKDPVLVPLTINQAMIVTNLLVYDPNELMSSEYNRSISAIRHQFHVAIGKGEARE